MRKELDCDCEKRTYSGSFVTQIFRNGKPNPSGDYKTFEMMTST